MQRNLVISCAILLWAIIVGCGGDDSSPMQPTDQPKGTTDVSPAIVTWLQNNAVPFKTPRPGSGFEDLMPLKQIVGDARIVSLGEATHGTREFFQMKHRILEFLVKEMGFNTFAIEATWPESNLVNNYIQTGNGNPAKLLAGLFFWTWNTQEVLDMILWMRENQVSFHGFDMQSPKMAMGNVLIFLQNVDSTAAELAHSLYACLDPFLNDLSSYAGVPAVAQSNCQEDLQQVFDLLQERQADYEALSSPSEFAVALRSARIVVQGEDVASRRGVATRDRYMAENVTWILDQAGPEARIVLWAHNFHVSFAPLNHNTMGSYLRDEYGDDMVIFGFSSFDGSFNAVTWNSTSNQFGGLNLHTTPPPPVDAYSSHFRASGMPRLFLDLRGIDFSSDATNWLTGPRPFRHIGSVYDRNRPARFFTQSRLPEEYDVVIYFQHTTRSNLLQF